MWRYQRPGFELLLLAELQRQQCGSQFCDTVLQSRGVSVPAHSCVLSAFSPQFCRTLSSAPMLSPGQKHLLEFHGVGPSTLLKLVRFLYSGELEGKEEWERQEVMSAIHQLGIGGLVEVSTSEGAAGGGPEEREQLKEREGMMEEKRIEDRRWMEEGDSALAVSLQDIEGTEEGGREDRREGGTCIDASMQTEAQKDRQGQGWTSGGEDDRRGEAMTIGMQVQAETSPQSPAIHPLCSVAPPVVSRHVADTAVSLDVASGPCSVAPKALSAPYSVAPDTLSGLCAIALNVPSAPHAITLEAPSAPCTFSPALACTDTCMSHPSEHRATVIAEGDKQHVGEADPSVRGGVHSVGEADPSMQGGVHSVGGADPSVGGGVHSVGGANPLVGRTAPMVVPLLPPGSAIPLSHILLMPPSQTDITLPSAPTVYSLGSYPLPSTPVVPPERLQAQAPSQLDSVSSVTGQGMEQGDVGEFQRFEGNIPGFISYFLNTGGAAEKDSGLTSQECGGEGGAKKKPGKRPRKEEGDGGGEKTTDGNWEACTRTRSGNVGGTRERGILRAVLKKRGRGGGVIGSCSNIRAGPISRRQPVRIRIKRHLDQEDTLDGRAGIPGGRASRRGCRPRRGSAVSRRRPATRRPGINKDGFTVIKTQRGRPRVRPLPFPSLPHHVLKALTFCPPCERAPSYPPPTAPSLPQSSCPAPSLSLAPDFLHTLPLPPAPQPTGEDSIEQIEKLLEDVMTGLNFLPPQVVASEAESGHGNSCSNASLRDPGHDLTKPSSHVSDAAAMVTVTSSSMMTETASCFTSPIETQADPNGSLLEALLKVPLPPTHRSGPPYTAHCQRGEGRPRSGRRDERSLQGAGSHIQEEGKATRQHACAVIGSPALPFHNSATCETSIPGLPPSGAAGSMRIRAISPNMHLPSDPSREAAVPEVPQQIGGELNNILDHFLWTFENQSSLQGSGEVAVTDDMNTTTRLANEPSAMNGPGQHGSVLHRSGIQGCAGLNEPTHTGASQVSGKQSSAELNGTDSKCRHTTRQIMISGFPGGDKPRDSCCSPITGRGSGPGLEPVVRNVRVGPQNRRVSCSRRPVCLESPSLPPPVARCHLPRQQCITATVARERLHPIPECPYLLRRGRRRVEEEVPLKPNRQAKFTGSLSKPMRSKTQSHTTSPDLIGPHPLQPFQKWHCPYSMGLQFPLGSMSRNEASHHVNASTSNGLQNPQYLYHPLKKENGLSGPTQGAAGVCRQKRSRPKRRGGSRKVWTKDRKQRIVTRRQNKEKKGVKGEEKDEKKNSSSQGRRSLKRGVDGLSQTQEDGTNGEVWHTRAKRLNSWEQNTDSLQKAELGGGRTMKGRPENGSHMGKRTSVCLVRLPGDCVNRTTRVCSAKPHEDCTGKQGFCLHKMEDFTYRTGPKSKSPAHHQWKTRNGGSHYMQEEERIVRVGEGKAAERPLKRGCVHPLDRRLKPREVPQVQQNEKGEWPLHQQRLREGGSEGEERRGLRSQRDISLLRRRKRRMDSEELTQAPSVKLRVVHAGKGGNAGEERGVEFGQEEPRARPHAGPESEPKLGDQCCDQSRRPVKGRVTGASPPMSSAFQKIRELLEHHQQSKSARESKNQQEGEAERVGDSQQEGEGEREGDSQQEGEGEREGDSQQEGEEEREGDSQQEGEEEREGDSQQKGDEEKDGDAEKDIGRGIFGGERKAEAGKGLVDSVTGMDRGMPEKEGAVDKTGSDKPEEQQEEQTVEGRVEDRVERDMDDESGNTSVSVDGGLHVTATVGRSVTLQSQNPLMASTINSDVIPNGEGAEGEKDREGVSKQRSVSAALCEESKLPLSSHSLIGQVLPPIQVSRWVTELSAGSFEQEDDDEEVEVDVMDSPCPTPLPLILLPGSWGEGLNPVTSSEDEDEEQYIDVIGEETD